MTLRRGFYYLHRETKQLIAKHENYEFTGDLVEKVWPVDYSDRGDAWRVVLEGAALGAREADLKHLSQQWKLTPEDCVEFMLRVPTEQLMRVGLARWCQVVLGRGPMEFLDELEQLMKQRKTKEVANG